MYDCEVYNNHHLFGDLVLQSSSWESSRDYI